MKINAKTKLNKLISMGKIGIKKSIKKISKEVITQMISDIKGGRSIDISFDFGNGNRFL